MSSTSNSSEESDHDSENSEDYSEDHPPIAGPGSTDPLDDLLQQDLTAGLPTQETLDDLLQQDLTAGLATQESLGDLLQQDLTAGLGTTEIIDEPDFINISPKGSITVGDLTGKSAFDDVQWRASGSAKSRRQRETSAFALETPPLPTFKLLNWVRQRIRARTVIEILGPVLGFLSLVQSCRLAQQSRESQKEAHQQRRREHQEVLVNQRQNSQRLDDLERQIKDTDDDRYITVTGKRSEVRTSPDSQAVITNRIRRDTQVEPITIDDGWVRIRYIFNGDERYGWVDATYLDTIDTQD